MGRKFERIIYDVSDVWMGFLIFDLRPGSQNQERKFYRQKGCERKTESGKMTNEAFFDEKFRQNWIQVTGSRIMYTQRLERRSH